MPRPSPAPDLPPCPLTGLPPLRRIQRLPRRLIHAIWRFGQGVDVSRLFEGVKHVGLYESPTGLIYFHPPIVGDGPFYDTYYRRGEIRRGLTRAAQTRADYLRTAGHIPAGARVIDVGCNAGLLRHHLAHAHYTGLDPYARTDDPAILRQTLEAHAATHAGRYEVATALHVIEHVADPLRHARLMAQLLKPSGLLILAAPLHPSALTQIPNLPLNMPPHHVTWWNPDAFRALAAALDLDVIEAVALPPSAHQAPIHWMHRLLLRRTNDSPDERYFAHRWSWHLSLLLAYALSKLATPLGRLPARAQPLDAYLVARKRAEGD